ncbi:MAG: hypothetical protein L0Z53_08655 [Acidobacteriales bacterium]|nr:hypothetical protein [Terriglobales bacterium]
MPGPPALPRLIPGLEPVTLKLNIIYDASADNRKGISADQKKKFEDQMLPHALKEYADSNVTLEPHFAIGSVEPNGLRGLALDAVNVFVSDRTPNRKPGVSSRARNSAFFTILDINKAEPGDLGHELSHHVLGDTYGLADRFVRFLGSVDPSLGLTSRDLFNTGFDIRNDLLRSGNLRYNKGTGGLMPISDFNRGARRLKKLMDNPAVSKESSGESP